MHTYVYVYNSDEMAGPGDSKKVRATAHAAEKASRTLQAKPQRGLATREKRALATRQKRSLTTLQQLLRAARAVFAQRGFEHARLEDIAAHAGKTRGAFYAHFKNKEDVFFAIFEEDLDRQWTVFRPILMELSQAEQRIDALAAFLYKLGKDKERTLLQQEFRVYAIRHPRRRKRLADLHAAMRLRCAIPEMDALLPELAQQRASVNRAGSLAVGAVLEGLALNQLFDPGALSEEQVMGYLRLCIREAFAWR